LVFYKKKTVKLVPKLVNEDLVIFPFFVRNNFLFYFTATSQTFDNLDAPFEPLTSKITTYLPASLYWWIGFCSVEIVPSPKSQCQKLISPSDSSIKATFFWFMSMTLKD